jgi:antitoxin VapB
MPLSIKNEEVERLTRAIAAETGESLTSAILTALQDRWERMKGRQQVPDLRQEIKRIQDRMACLERLDDGTDEEILGYDQDGVPH